MKIVFTPDWFLGKDVLIGGIQFFSFFAVFYTLHKNLQIKQKQKHKSSRNRLFADCSCSARNNPDKNSSVL